MTAGSRHTTKSKVEQVCEEFYCTYCGARPGEQCHSLTGKSFSMIPHGARFDAATAHGKLPLR